MGHKADTPRGRGKTETVYQGERVTGVDRHGQRVTGIISGFAGGRHQTTVIRSAGYTYLLETRDVEKA